MPSPKPVSMFSGWVRELPYSSRVVYLALLAIGSIVAIAFRYLAGGLPAGEWTTRDVVSIISDPLVIVAILAVHQYIDNELLEGLNQAKAISALSDESFSKVRHDLTFVPLVPYLVIGILAAVVGLAQGPESFGLDKFELRTVPFLLLVSLVASLTFGYAYAVIRLVVLLGRFYSGPMHLNLFNLPPLYELPNVAGKAGLFLLIIWYASVLFFFHQVRESTVILVVATLVALIPLAAFVVPHAALSRRLGQEKTRRIAHTNSQLELAFRLLGAELKAGNLANLDKIKAGVETLNSERQFVESIPTWPWRFGTFRITITAVLLPVLVWIIQQVLDRFLPF